MHERRLTRRVRCGLVVLLAGVILAGASSGLPVTRGAELDLKAMFHESIPASPFIAVVYRYADTMLKDGRDTYGPQKTGLLLSALDRKTLAPLEDRPPAPAGVAEAHRPGARGERLVGANLQADQNLLRLLYFLVGLSGDARYGQAADEMLKWFLVNAPSPNTGLLPWGEHLCWDVMSDQVASGTPAQIHEFSRPWMLWGKCFELAPRQSKRFAMGLCESAGVTGCGGEKVTRDASPDHPITPSPPHPITDDPRHAGFFIRTWAEAYAHTGDETFLGAIDVLLTRCLRHRAREGMTGCGGDGVTAAVLSTSRLSLAIDCGGAARKVPQPLRTRLGRFAASEDRAFCLLPHDLRNKQGFALRGRCEWVTAAPSPDHPVTPSPSHPLTPSPPHPLTSPWNPGHGRDTTAAVGMMCVSRYENTGKVEYRNLAVAAAEVYLDSLPEDGVDAWPMTFGHAISLELAAFRATAKAKYHARAFRLGEIAVEKFFGESPLPRASLKTDHYESVTGAGTLVLALAELHLSTLAITAVRAPAGTIDR